jgi:hypothetical protein
MEPLMAKRRRRELVEADKFHARVVSLMCVSHAHWTEWEEEWLEDEARRPADYIYTDTERVILDQLIICSMTFTHYSECSIQELLKSAYACRKDFDEDDEAFLEQVHAWRATDLKLRQISRLANLCRLVEPLERDEAVGALMRALRKRESSDHRRGENDGYGRFA